MRDRLIIGRVWGTGIARRTPNESHALVLGVPSSGKTTAIIEPNLLDWDGPALATSSKNDVVNLCAAPRLKKGRVWVLDLRTNLYSLPEGVERAKWSPLHGCGDWDVARRRAAAMCSATKGGDDSSGQYWSIRGTQILAPCFHAAALAGLPLRRCLGWLRSSDLDAPRRICEEHGALEAADQLREVSGSGDAHKGSVIGTAVAATAALGGRLLEDADAATFDPASFYEGDSNTFLAIAPMDAIVDTGSILAAIVDQLYAELKHRFESGRPVARPVLFAVDEAGAIPLKSLPGMLAEGRAYGLRALLATQSWSQIKQRFGQAGADTIRDATRTTVVFGGVTDADLLQNLERLSGNVWKRHRGSTQAKEGSWQPRHPAAGIHRLPKGKVLVFAGSHPKTMAAASYWKLWGGIREMVATPAQHRRDQILRTALLIANVVAALLMFAVVSAR